MKAWLIEETAPAEEKKLALREVEKPEPGKGEVQIKISACGVCHTDLHAVEGELPLPTLPIIPGHQVVGKVSGNGESAKRFKPGERVGIAWLRSACGKCGYCRSGLENLCDSISFTGFHSNGGYAEYITAPEDFVYPLPDHFDDLHAAPLLCAGIIGYRALRLSEIKSGETLGIFGFGASAHIAIQIAIHRGANVYVFTRSKEHREHAMKLGAVWAGSADDPSPALLSAAISFAPAGSLIPKAMEKLDKGGTLALAGVYVDDVPRMDYEKHLFNEKRILSVTASTRSDGIELLRASAEIPVKTDIKPYPFERAPEALIDLKHSRINGAAVLRIK
ncbi:MAG: zinc-dependent alcohol dehydrogenase family protein [Nitrospinota bacterium]|nr:zinc-dependent alcohol dehydrogenase family protein [Nitrospinota bacterium]